MDNNCEKKRRGRKKKTDMVQEVDSTPVESMNVLTPSSENIFIEIETDENTEEEAADTTKDQEVSGAKKRGRKPKGGKLVVKQHEQVVKTQIVSNVILHLKCSLNDLHEYNDKLNKLVTDPMSYNPAVPPEIMTYNEDNALFSKYDTLVPETENTISYAYDDTLVSHNTNVCSLCMGKKADTLQNEIIDDDANINMKDINTKLKKLKINLYKNNLGDKKSACFWCTYDYDNHPCYIPKYEMDGTVFGYGSFCRPECAVAYLMKENIDDSTKFERYHLLNQIYSKVYDYKKNIKPAPNPFYLLEKYYGNMTIQEYRKMLKTEHMLLVIDKPLTRILPELHEDNEDMILNIYGGTKSNSSSVNNGVYKVKKQSEKPQGPSKTTIMRDTFGLA
jgi:hypothetical protein